MEYTRLGNKGHCFIPSLKNRTLPAPKKNDEGVALAIFRHVALANVTLYQVSLGYISLKCG